MWFLSPSGWPTFADSPEEQADLIGAGYAPIDESQVQAAIDAYNAGQPPPAAPDFVTVTELQTATSPAVQALAAAFGAVVRLTTAVGDGVAVDTAPINAVLASAPAGATVQGIQGSTYLVDGPLILRPGGHQTLDMRGCTIIMKSGTNLRMLSNSAYLGTGARDSNITIIGGTWNKQDNTGSGPNAGIELHCLIFHRLDGLLVQDVTVTNTAAKYCILICDVDWWEVTRPTFDGHSDGLHVAGPANYGLIQSPRGITQDDFVALTSTDFAPQATPGGGDITHVTIRDVVYDPGNKGNAVKLDADGGKKLQHILVEHVGGTAAYNMVSLTNSATPTTPRDIDDIVIRDVSGTVGDGYNMVAINGAGMGNVLLDGAELTEDDNPRQQGCLVAVQNDFSTEVQNLILRNVRVRSTTIAHQLLATWTGAKVHNIMISGLDADVVNSTRLLNLDGVIERVGLSQIQVTFDAVAGSGAFIFAWVPFDTYLDVGSLTNVQTLHWNASSVATEANLFLNSLQCLNLNNLAVTSDGSGNGRTRIHVGAYGQTLQNAGNIWQQAAGSQISATGVQFPTRLGDITPQDGDIVFNDDGSLSCGTGPVIFHSGGTGNGWKHLYTGATY